MQSKDTKMKFTQTIQTNNYIFKNFFYIFPFALIPAFCLALSVASETMSEVIGAFFTGNLSAWTFSNLFSTISVFNFDSWHTALWGFLGLVVIVPCISLLMAFLEKHMRIGKRTLNGLLSKLNDNFLSTFMFGTLILFAYELFALITASTLYLCAMIPNLVVAYIFIVLSYLSLHVALLYALGTIYLWLPCMQITGFRALEALQHAHQLVQPTRKGIFLEQFFFLLIVETLVGLFAVVAPSTMIFTLITTACMVFFLLYYFVRMEIVYFERENLERADLKKY